MVAGAWCLQQHSAAQGPGWTCRGGNATTSPGCRQSSITWKRFIQLAPVLGSHFDGTTAWPIDATNCRSGVVVFKAGESPMNQGRRFRYFHVETGSKPVPNSTCPDGYVSCRPMRVSAPGRGSRYLFSESGSTLFPFMARRSVPVQITNELSSGICKTSHPA